MRRSSPPESCQAKRSSRPGTPNRSSNLRPLRSGAVDTFHRGKVRPDPPPPRKEIPVGQIERPQPGEPVQARPRIGDPAVVGDAVVGTEEAQETAE